MAKRRSSRRLSKIFELWQTTNVSDGFGGNLVEDTLITSSWGEIKSINSNSKYRKTEFGVTSANNVIVIKTRKRNDLTYNITNQFIKYLGIKYIISNQPNEIDYDNMYIEIIATKAANNNIVELSPINSSFPYTFPFKLN